MPIKIVIEICEVTMPDGIKRLGMDVQGKGENVTHREGLLATTVKAMIGKGAFEAAQVLPGAQRTIQIERDTRPAGGTPPA